MNNTKPGTIIKGSHWPEPVQVNLIEEQGGYIHIVGATIDSKVHIDQVISKKDFDKITIESLDALFTEEAWKGEIIVDRNKREILEYYKNSIVHLFEGA